MKKLLFLILSLGCLSIVQAQTGSKNPNTAIGKTFKKISDIDVFKSYKEEDGVLITESKEQKNIFSKISDGSRTMVLFIKYLPQGDKILAILDIGKIEKNMRILLRECRVNNKTDGFVVALVNAKPWKAYFTNMIKAWRVDPNKNTFNAISVKGIDCLNEEFDNVE